MININKEKIWLFFFLGKVFYMIFAVFVFSKLTILGDTERYISASFPDLLSTIPFLSEDPAGPSTVLMDLIGAISRIISLNTILVHIPCVILSFIGIRYAVLKLNLSTQELILLLAVLSFPSFGIWTSIVSKEAIGSFYMGIICGYLIEVLKVNRYRLNLLELLAFYLCLLFKPQYMIAILHILLIAFIFRLQLNAFINVLLIGVITVSEIIIIYYFSDLIESFASLQHLHFSIEDSNSTRDDPWVNSGDFFKYAPVGMFVAFAGPTILEVMEKPIQAPFFIESVIICLIVFYWFVKSMYIKGFVYISLQNLSLWFFTYFWLLFVHYPFGALNPGSGIRYRCNFLILFIVFGYYLYMSSNKSFDVVSLDKKRALD
ncbi:hypothetical protein BWI97_04580 [Siphonobacter sp. BAB-5405]|nr:hypothetical protein BWI97_04580 [Siphonobacter sp. BAB-5405]